MYHRGYLSQGGAPWNAGWDARKLLIQAERLAAKGQVEQVRFQERRRRLVEHQHIWQQKLAERQGQREKVAQALRELEERPFYDFDLEKSLP